MILNTILLVLALAGAGALTYLFSLFNVWFWLLILPFWMVSYYILFALWIVFLVIWGKFLPKDGTPEKPNFFYNSIVRQTDYVVMCALQVHIKVRGGDKLPKDHKVLYVNNHISNFDQMAMIAAFRSPMLAVTKPENLHFPIAGPFIRAAGFVPINREDPKEGIKAIEKVSSFLEKGICDIEISPEGTRNKTDNLLLPFHAGSFRAGMDAKAPIVVLCIKGTNEVKHRTPLLPTTVYLDILKVIYPEEYEGKRPAEIRDEAVALIKKDLEGGIFL
ncbi:MAG: 1-acyl-sn-glycerol-3-phosphate acyltransferase [Candidatus Enteromonas sp.]|jgi:1-acyl-sn-glycerol-3-phosphate acyltransferase|nr:1-acyl-sn-glycerol-3-phosphate acyltransferase [Bacilli bacterium]MBQ2052859.1 1-acyl-sn-glycerol-3-phosphate acyltransferase [Bacilli bacterium]MBQ4182234.1 1-acyl-sn-glycerol-3-phosphate acyltransferase [Bacilli bacterium]MEE3299224.1 1-acyl-sn-glycerol-3-phosphate acyltransferase [Candidatus Enteromonas sp.]MEE3431620.1 1-acyl-sn-glycerol-3-phosphate acyltransferase [Candidatus Enteromonas sp.]